MTQKRPKAIALMSGGLDSTLAAKIVKDQGVDVLGLHLSGPFGCNTKVSETAENIGVPLIVKDKGESYLDLVKNPKYGYGSQMNPCIDCRIFMFQLAHVVMLEENADFILTGEVLGQRPMSQRRDAISIIDRDSRLKGLILRPLSAHCFSPTLPEEQGWVDRSRLLAIVGRGRREQLALAAQMGITEYETPAGGCLLTEGGFTSRLKDFFTFDNPESRLARSELLRHGRHFRLSQEIKVILGRNKEENEALSVRWREAHGTFFAPLNFEGPSAIALGPIENQERVTVGEMIARYSKSTQSEKQISFESQTESGTFLVEQPMAEERMDALRI